MHNVSRHFGNLLRQWRLRQHLSQEELARRSGVSVRTIRYWENAHRRPSGDELERVLNALQVTIEERHDAYRLNPRPDIQRRDQELVKNLPVSAAEKISLPHPGELLRALRQRCGKTQKQLAREIGVTLTAVSRWETLRKYPSADNIDRLCEVLQAKPEEEYALRSRQSLLSHTRRTEHGASIEVDERRS